MSIKTIGMMIVGAEGEGRIYEIVRDGKRFIANELDGADGEACVLSRIEAASYDKLMAKIEEAA